MPKSVTEATREVDRDQIVEPRPRSLTAGLLDYQVNEGAVRVLESLIAQVTCQEVEDHGSFSMPSRLLHHPRLHTCRKPG